MLSPYIKQFILAVTEELSYRTDFFIRFFTGFISAYARVAIWFAIMASNKDIIGSQGADATIKYMILATIVSSLMGCIPNSEITNRITTGEIGRDLIYPVDLPANIFFKSLGSAFVFFITKALPTLVILTIIFRPSWNMNLVNLSAFIVSVLFSYFLYFNLNLQIDMISFWLLENYSLSGIKFALYGIFSGSLVPLWYYPKWLLDITNLLPFKNMVFGPVSIFLEPGSNQFLSYFSSNIFWAVFMTLLSLILWKRGIRRVEVQGG